MKVSAVVCALLVVFVEAGPAKQYVAEPSYRPAKQNVAEPSYRPADYHDSYAYKPAYAPYLNVSLECGIVPRVNRYFLHNFDDLAFGEYPWHVALIDGRNRKFLCSGTLVSDYHVVTTASCVDYIPRSDIVVRLGEWDIRTTQNPEEVYRDLELGVSRKLAHPQYKDSSYGAYDVAVLALGKVVDFDRYPQIIPICLPDYVSEDYGVCYVAGWEDSEVERLRIDSSEPITIDHDTVSYDLTHDSAQYEEMVYKAPKYPIEKYKELKYDRPVQYDVATKYKRSASPYAYEQKPYYTYVPEIDEVPKHSHKSDYSTAPIFSEDLSQTLDFARVKKVEYDPYGKGGDHQFLVEGVDGYRACKADVGSSYACIAHETYNKHKRSADKAYDAPARKSFQTGPTSDYDRSTRLVLSGIVLSAKPCSRSSGLEGLVSSPGIGSAEVPYGSKNYPRTEDSANVLSIKPVLEFILSSINGQKY